MLTTIMKTAILIFKIVGLVLRSLEIEGMEGRKEEDEKGARRAPAFNTNDQQSEGREPCPGFYRTEAIKHWPHGEKKGGDRCVQKATIPTIPFFFFRENLS